jgi:hypothetical protein
VSGIAVSMGLLNDGRVCVTVESLARMLRIHADKVAGWPAPPNAADQLREVADSLDLAAIDFVSTYQLAPPPPPRPE